jgi:hypothetical protein
VKVSETQAEMLDMIKRHHDDPVVLMGKAYALGLNVARSMVKRHGVELGLAMVDAAATLTEGMLEREDP